MATRRDPRVAIAPAYLAEARRQRRPQHRFNLKTKPWQLQPFMLAPVLPGETLTNLVVQAQCWSTPLKSDLRNIGWWKEYFFFYVRHRDLGEDIRAAVTNLMLDPNNNLDAFRDADGNVATYCYPGAVDWTMRALQRVVEEFFRDEGENWDEATIGGLPAAKIFGKGASDWTEKLTLGADYEDRRVNLDADGDGEITVDDVNRAYQHWAAMRDAGLTDMDYQDFIATYGQQVREEETSVNLHRPEDLAHSREWTYPTNTVEPTTGVPAVAVGWRTGYRSDKRFRFDEPGFLIGITCARPKVYLGNQLGSVAGAMQNVMTWLPAVLNDQFNVSHVHFPEGSGPLGNLLLDDLGYWVDLRDLLNYGDQFVNYDPAVDAVPFVGLPDVNGSRRYAASADADALFTDGATGNLLEDGVVTLGILGRQKERSKNLVLGKA